MTAGRKLSFNKELALEAAMNVFWQKGYVGTSLSDLTRAMGINKPSMYSTFGNKEALFSQTTTLYAEQQAAPHLKWLEKSDMSLKDRVKGFLMSTIDGQCKLSMPRGCYIAACIAESSNDSVPEKIRQMVLQINQHMQSELEALFLNDEESKALNLDKRAACIALGFNTLLSGTATMARAGKTEKELEKVVDIVLLGIGLE